MILGWPLLILLAVAGWGFGVARMGRRLAGAGVYSSADILPLGVATILAIGGVALAVDGFSGLFVGLLIAGGVGLAIWGAVEVLLGHRASLDRRLVGRLIIGAGLVAALYLLALSRTAHFHWNPCDDDAAYLYLAKRLLVRGDLLDPLNNRRLTSLGGMSYLQALFLFRLPDAFLPLVDLFLGSVVLLFTLWRRQGRQAFLGMAAGLLIIVFPDNLQPAANTSPVLLPIGLALAAFALGFSLMLDARCTSAFLRAGGVGLLLGASITLRPQFGPPLGLSVLAMLAWVAMRTQAPDRMRQLGVAVAGAAAGSMLSLGGWALASLRAVGTPLFPLAAGNLDPSWPVNGLAIKIPSLSSFLGRLSDALILPPWIVALVAGLTMLALLSPVPATLRRYRNAALILHAAASLAALLLPIYLAYAWWGQGDLRSYARFWAPELMAAVLLPFIVLAAGDLANGPRLRIGGVALVAAVALLTVAGLAVPPVTSPTLAADLVSGRLLPMLEADRYAGLRGAYAEARALTPAHSMVLTAVDVPSLLLSRSYDIHTLDIPGSTSPAPHMPLFGGRQAMLDWLRGHGYTEIIAVDPMQSACLYNLPLKVRDLAGQNGPVYQAWAPYDFAWFDFLARVSGPGSSSRHVGPLIVVPL